MYIFTQKLRPVVYSRAHMAHMESSTFYARSARQKQLVMAIIHLLIEISANRIGSYELVA